MVTLVTYSNGSKSTIVLTFSSVVAVVLLELKLLCGKVVLRFGSDRTFVEGPRLADPWAICSFLSAVLHSLFATLAALVSKQLQQYLQRLESATFTQVK